MAQLQMNERRIKFSHKYGWQLLSFRLVRLKCKRHFHLICQVQWNHWDKLTNTGHFLLYCALYNVTNNLFRYLYAQQTVRCVMCVVCLCFDHFSNVSMLSPVDSCFELKDAIVTIDLKSCCAVMSSLFSYMYAILDAKRIDKWQQTRRKQNKTRNKRNELKWKKKFEITRLAASWM